MVIQVTNQKCKLVGDIKIIEKLKKHFNIKNPNAFHIRRRGNIGDNWDGKINYITSADYFKTGLLPQVVNFLEKVVKVKVKLEDYRKEWDIKPKKIRYVGEHTLKGDRQYQGDAIHAITHNTVGDINFPIGAINAATNAGKTTIMAGIHEAYRRKIPTLILLNDGDLFEQFKREMPLLLRDEDIGFIRGKKDNTWGNITIAMVQTLTSGDNLRKFRKQIESVGILLVDEGDLADNNSYKSVINMAINAAVRAALSGSIFLSRLKKDLPRNQNLHCIFGDEVFRITKAEMVELGHSTPIIVNIYKGSTKAGMKGDFKGEYDSGIMYNEDRALECVKRLKFQAKLKRLPALIVCQFHDHIDLMYKIFQSELGHKYKIEMVHGDTKNRKDIFERYRVGKVDILISSFIVKRGKNMPLVRYIQNAAGSDSQETIWQIMGRGERKDQSKKKVYMDDFMDEGVYLMRHSKHRIRYYKESGMKVIMKC